MTGDDIGIVVAVGPNGASLIVTADSSSARGTLGPVAWSALEVLALRAERDVTSALVVVLGVRELAGHLGVGRDAAANALSTLRSVGLISATQQRAGRGRFDGTSHTILLPVVTELAPAPRARPARSRPVREVPPPASLSLFDDPSTSPREDVNAVRHDTLADHSSPVAEDVTRKLHELAFDRMPTRPRRRGGGVGSC